MLAGEVEVDETFIGGKARNMHKIRREKMRDRSWHGKAAVIGLLQRHTGEDKSNVRTSVVQTTRKRELHPLVEQHVEDGAKVYTDELRSYENLGVYYEHQVINHAETYVRGEVHTNGMENFWSLLKRSIHAPTCLSNRSTCSDTSMSSHFASTSARAQMGTASPTRCDTWWADVSLTRN